VLRHFVRHFPIRGCLTGSHSQNNNTLRDQSARVAAVRGIRKHPLAYGEKTADYFSFLGIHLRNLGLHANLFVSESLIASESG
jgi:hypothetical protein